MSREYPEYPILGVGGVVIHENQVLLVRRGQQPSRGEWAIPGGRVELGETMRQAVEREILEETGVNIRAGEQCYQFEVIFRDEDGRVKYHYVIVDFLAEYLGGEPQPASDVSGAAWIKAGEINDFYVNKKTLALLKKLEFIY